MNQIQKSFGFLLLLAVIGALSWYVISDRPVSLELPVSLQNTILREPKEVEPFHLMTQHRVPFNQDQLTGKWSWVFFGYTHCPDICPTTLATMKSVSEKLEKIKNSDQFQFIFVTVDPQRDTPQHMKQYLAYFNPEFIGLTGEQREIDSLAQQFGTIYTIEGNTNKDDYIVNHSVTIALIDPDGRYYARLNPPFMADNLVENFERIRRFHGSR